jgi:hypothetical protein
LVWILDFAMIESLHWWLSLHRNSNFWAWMEDTYSVEELRRLISEATDCSLIRRYDPLADQYYSRKGKPEQVVLTETVRRLYRRYHADIWSICLDAGGHFAESGPFGLESLARLDRCREVYDQEVFEEFLVRNALKYAARQVLERIEARRKTGP